MELEFQRKLITLENSVKDIDERLAELYRDMAGLSLHKATILQKVKRDVAASRKHANDVKQIHFDLKSGLDDVSTKLARMDTVIKRLNSMRRDARKEKSKEFSELASSLLKLNRKVSKMNKLIENVRAAQHDPRIDVLQRELLDLKNITSEKPSKMASVNVNAALEHLEKMLDQKIDSGQLREALGDVSGALSVEINELHKKISSIPKGATAGVASPIDTKRIDEVHKKVDIVRERANSILKEIYDTMDALHGTHAGFENQAAKQAEELEKIKKKLSLLEKQVKILPRGAVGEEAELDISGLVADVEELRTYVDTLIKGLDVSKVLTEEMKAIEAKLSSIEEWRSRMTDFPRELERLAERLAEIEIKPPAQVVPTDIKDQTDMKNLKMAVAELSNKVNLINSLALENQKLQHRLFLLEDELKSREMLGEDN